MERGSVNFLETFYSTFIKEGLDFMNKENDIYRTPSQYLAANPYTKQKG